MNRTLTAAALLAAVFIAFAPKQARACGGGSSGLVVGEGVVVGALLIGITVVVADLGVAGSDFSHSSRGTVPSLGHGIGELLLAAPQIALAGALLNGSLHPGAYNQTSPGAVVASGAYLAFSAALGVHAIWTFANQDRHFETYDRESPGIGERRFGLLQPKETPPAAPQGPTLALVPTLLADKSQHLGPGVGALLRF